MKKIFAIICATITLFSCSQSDLVEIDNTKNQNPQDNHVNFNIKVDGETKALKSSWATGDVIYIMFKNIKNKYVAITYNGATWDAQAYDANNTATTIEVEELPSENRLAAAVHFPVAVDVALDATDGVLSFTKNDMPVRTNFVKQKNQSYTVDGSTVNLTLSLQKDMYWVLFHVAGIQKYPQDYKLVITPKGNAQPINFMCTSLSHTGAVTNSLINDPQGFQGYADADGVIFPVYFSNGNGLNTDIEYDFTVKSSVLECTISGTLNLKAGYQYSLPALADSKWTKNYKYVDMGNGTKWATGNVGAYSLYDYGDYFAWGDTVPYYEAGHAQDNPQNYWKEGKTAGYFWNSYKWIEPTEDDQGDLIYNSDNITKYSFADGNTYGRWYNGNDFVGDEGDGVEHKDFASYNYVDDPARYNEATEKVLRV